MNSISTVEVFCSSSIESKIYTCDDFMSIYYTDLETCLFLCFQRQNNSIGDKMEIVYVLVHYAIIYPGETTEEPKSLFINYKIRKND